MFTQQLWQNTLPVFEKIIAHPFLQELKQGNLPPEKFIFYLQQDALYLPDFARALAIAAAKAPTNQEFLTCIEFAKGAMAAELDFHQKFLTQHNAQLITKKAQACKDYTHFLLATAHHCSYAEILAALLPCFWIYHAVGAKLIKESSEHAYSEWIKVYAGDNFQQQVEMMLMMVNRAADEANVEIKAKMAALYQQGVEFEYLFWDDAY